MCCETQLTDRDEAAKTDAGESSATEDSVKSSNLLISTARKRVRNPRWWSNGEVSAGGGSSQYHVSFFADL
jgi:hypothetical protein